MSEKNIVRNTGDARTVTYDGIDYFIPGGGDTTMLSPDCALFVQRNHTQDGITIVHPEVEAAARKEADLDPEERVAAAEAVLESAIALKDGPLCKGFPEVSPGVKGDVPCKRRTKNASGLCQNCDPEEVRRKKAEAEAISAEQEAIETQAQLDEAHSVRVAVAEAEARKLDEEKTEKRPDPPVSSQVVSRQARLDRAEARRKR